MCGILAIIGNILPVSLDQANQALDTLAHRGPDDRGVWHVPGAWLGHRRLSIIDTSSAGHQPMVDEITGVALTFNGEIYNYIELRNELEALGHHFHSRSDTEVLLRSYLAWGEKCVERFNGDWAFLIWDPRVRAAFFSRDRFAVKPLYYTRARGVLSIASEPKALLELYPELRCVNERALYRFLKESALYDNTDCFYEGIQLLQPAHWAVYHLDEDKITPVRYWNCPSGDDQMQGDVQTKFDTLFEDAVRLRMRSDVPVGITLSGGLDSTAVMSSAERHLGVGSVHMTAFTSVYENKPDAAVDERKWAALAAENCVHVDLQLVEATSKLWVPTLRKIIYHMDGPGYSPAVFPLWHIARSASQQGVPVLMEGQGADELLGGYTNHAAAAFFENLGFLLRSFKWGALGRDLMGYFAAFGVKAFSISLARIMFPWMINFNYRFAGLLDVIRADFIKRVDPQLGILSPERNNTSAGFFERVIRYDFSNRILPGLLQYGDTVSMANAIESRLPFLDYRLVEFCARLPIKWKIRSGQTKYILREYLRRIGQSQIANRKDKKGYPTPIEQLFKSNDGELLRELLLAHDARIRAYCDQKKIRKLINRYLSGQKRIENPLYRLLSAELWLQECFPESI